MKHLMPTLPYAPDALAPAMSAETLSYHYGKHLQTYVDNLNRLVAGTDFEEKPLEDIVRCSSGALYNNAAQTWNHTFFFESLTPSPAPMSASLEKRLAEAFGSVEAFREQLAAAVVGLFGSGWVWLVADGECRLSIVAEPNAGNPLRAGLTPLLTVDVWEHAYYIDYRNRRADYFDAVWALTDWEKVEKRMQSTTCNVYI